MNDGGVGGLVGDVSGSGGRGGGRAEGGRGKGMAREGKVRQSHSEFREVSGTCHEPSGGS